VDARRAGIRREPSAAAFTEAAQIIGARLDIDRMPWLASERSPEGNERSLFVERTAATVAGARVLAERRNLASKRQEEATRQAAHEAGYEAVSPPGALDDPIQLMPPASYAKRARKLNKTNMDVPIRLKQGHGRTAVRRRGVQGLQLVPELAEATPGGRSKARPLG
jgi:hypothetical protein